MATKSPSRFVSTTGARRMFLIAVTGWGQDEDRQRSEEVGLNLHMVKPVEPAVLEDLLANLRLAERNTA